MSTPLTPDSPTGTPNAEKRCVACEKKRRIKALKMCSACYDRDLERRREADGGVLVPIVTSRRRGDLVQCLGCAAEFYRAPSSKVSLADLLPRPQASTEHSHMRKARMWSGLHTPSVAARKVLLPRVLRAG